MPARRTVSCPRHHVCPAAYRSVIIVGRLRHLGEVGTGTPRTVFQVSVPLTAPREGTPEPVESPAALEQSIMQLANGTGPVAIDAERASGYRYTQRAYLVQLRRAGAGTVLIDPIPLGDLRPLDEAIDHTEWVLHAASQDLPCLAELGMRPRRLFDTELAARLAGFERVGLATLAEQLLGYQLEKHHSAADWSTRPLPPTWLAYAALDVELLLELRDLLAAELVRQDKLGWAAQEFAALAASAGSPPKIRPDPWRRTSGIHRVRGARALARVRALWYARDQIAARRDTAPGRVLPDAAIIAAAEMDPADERSLLVLPGFGGRSVRRLARSWLAALAEARDLPDDALPTTPTYDGPPPPHRWAERDPAAAARLTRCRAVVTELATTHQLPPENLITPEHIRRLAWQPPDELTPAAVGEALAGYGARPWQVELLAAELAAALDTTD
jgi:ribonuclease D